MADVNIPQEILHKIINLGGLKKELFCSKCNTFTEHVSFSYGEIPWNSTWKSMFFRAVDYVPFYGPILLGNPFSCKACGKIRSDGGLLSDDWNKKDQGTFKKPEG